MMGNVACRDGQGWIWDVWKFISSHVKEPQVWPIHSAPPRPKKKLAKKLLPKPTPIVIPTPQQKKGHLFWALRPSYCPLRPSFFGAQRPSFWPMWPSIFYFWANRPKFWAKQPSLLSINWNRSINFWCHLTEAKWWRSIRHNFPIVLEHAIGSYFGTKNKRSIHANTKRDYLLRRRRL